MNFDKLAEKPNNESQEIEVSAKRETFEAQVLVMSKPYKKRAYPLSVNIPFPMEQTHRIIDAGQYKLELVPSHLANGKPTLIIYEKEQEE